MIEKNCLVRLPLHVKIYLRFGSSRFLIYISQLIPSIVFSILIVVFLTIGYAKTGQKSALFADPNFAAFFGTLTGVFVGAFIGGIISLQLHKESLRATSAVKDKEAIYKILYDGLMKFKSDITQKEDKYCAHFVFATSDPRIKTGSPKFTEWGQIKNDSRYIQVPKWMRDIFEFYLRQFDKYQDLLRSVQNDIISTKKKIAQEVGLNYRVIPGLDDDFYLTGVINQNQFNLRHGLNFDESNLKDVDVNDLEQKAIAACLFLPSVERVRSFYDNVLIKNTCEIISVLEMVIQYINNKYENQDNVI